MTGNGKSWILPQTTTKLAIISDADNGTILNQKWAFEVKIRVSVGTTLSYPKIKKNFLYFFLDIIGPPEEKLTEVRESPRGIGVSNVCLSW